MDSKYVAACGLTCCDCLFYKPEFFEAANTLKKLIDEYGFDIFYRELSKQEVSAEIAEHLKQDNTKLHAMFRVFEKMPEFLEVLNGILRIRCRHTCREKHGCSIGGGRHQCDVIECVTEKRLEGCWKCSEYGTCSKLAFQKKHYGRTVAENLAQLEREGMNCLQPRGNQYYEWQRRAAQAKESSQRQH